MMTYSVIVNNTVRFYTRNAQEFDSYCKENYDELRFENVIYDCIPDGE